MPESVSAINLSFLLLPLKLLQQMEELEQALSLQSLERDELTGQLDKITEDHTSASQNSESMAGKIQVREAPQSCSPVNSRTDSLELLPCVSSRPWRER